MMQSTDSTELEDDEDLHSDGDAGDGGVPSATMPRQMRCATCAILSCHVYAMQLLLSFWQVQGKHFAVVC